MVSAKGIIIKSINCTQVLNVNIPWPCDLIADLISMLSYFVLKHVWARDYLCGWFYNRNCEGHVRFLLILSTKKWTEILSLHNKNGNTCKNGATSKKIRSSSMSHLINFILSIFGNAAYANNITCTFIIKLWDFDRYLKWRILI